MGEGENKPSFKNPMNFRNGEVCAVNASHKIVVSGTKTESGNRSEKALWCSEDPEALKVSILVHLCLNNAGKVTK